MRDYVRAENIGDFFVFRSEKSKQYSFFIFGHQYGLSIVFEKKSKFLTSIFSAPMARINLNLTFLES